MPVGTSSFEKPPFFRGYRTSVWSALPAATSPLALHLCEFGIHRQIESMLNDFGAQRKHEVKVSGAVAPHDIPVPFDGRSHTGLAVKLLRQYFLR